MMTTDDEREAGRIRLAEVTREAFASRADRLRRNACRTTLQMLLDGCDVDVACTHLTESVLGEQAVAAGIAVPGRWHVACGCGYVVDELPLGRAVRLAERHNDDDCEALVARSG